jgi:hypothetical protein
VPPVMAIRLSVVKYQVCCERPGYEVQVWHYQLKPREGGLEGAMNEWNKCERPTYLQKTIVARSDTSIHRIVGSSQYHTTRPRRDIPSGGLSTIHRNEWSTIGDTTSRHGSRSTLGRKTFLISARNDELVVCSFSYRGGGR